MNKTISYIAKIIENDVYNKGDSISTSTNCLNDSQTLEIHSFVKAFQEREMPMPYPLKMR